MSLLSRIRIPMIDAGEHEGVTHLLNELATRLPGRLEPLEWLVDTYGRTSDSFRMPDALAQLGDALVASGKLDRAKDVFQQLVDREPESEPAKRKLNDVLKKLGMVEEEATPPADIVVVTDDLQPELPKAPAPKIRPDFEEVVDCRCVGNAGDVAGGAGTRRRDTKVHRPVADRRGSVCQLRADAEGHRIVGSDLAPGADAHSYTRKIAGLRVGSRRRPANGGTGCATRTHSLRAGEMCEAASVLANCDVASSARLA